jgi:riboflavin synthase
VSVSGTCLTVASVADGAFEADVANQTLSVTTLGDLQTGAPVNLEPPLRAGDPLGGHLVQGHVDGTGEVRAVRADGFARRLRLEAPRDLARFIVERGSVTVDGVDDGFEVSLIPETLERTTLGGLGDGGQVNLEVDVIARYAERLVQGFEKERS